MSLSHPLARAHQDLSPTEAIAVVHAIPAWAAGEVAADSAEAARAPRVLWLRVGRIAELNALRIVARAPEEADLVRLAAGEKHVRSGRAHHSSALANAAADAIYDAGNRDELVVRARERIEETLAEWTPALAKKPELAAMIIGGCGRATSLPALTEVSRSARSRAGRRSALLARAALGDATLIDEVIDRTPKDDDDGNAALAAIGALGHPRAVRPVIDALLAGRRAAAVAEALSDLGVAAVEGVVEAVRQRPDLVRTQRVGLWTVHMHRFLEAHVLERLERGDARGEPATAKAWDDLCHQAGMSSPDIAALVR